MAYYENLPIYKKAFELIVCVENAVRNFSRYHKYSIGTDMRHLSRNLVFLIIQANSRQEKVCLLTELRDRSEEMKIMVMVGKEIKAFNSFKQFENVANLAVEISKQSEGWLGSQRKQQPELPNV